MNEMKTLTLNGKTYDSFQDSEARKSLEQKQPKGNYVKSVNGIAPDENGNVNVEGGTGGVGADGFSPIATVTQTDTGATISITDKSGTTTATIANGKDGAKGDKGDTGAQGNPGKDGANGKDGVSATHSWNGTTLTITSASGTSSANLKGDKGDKGDQGIQGETGAKGDTGEQGPQGIQGPKGDTGATGATGAAGYTPVRGTDYWTEADKAEIVAAVIESLGGNPVFGYVDENNNIIVSGNLPDGTYSVKYEMEDGSTVNIGNLVLDTNVYYSVTNTLTNCVSSNSDTQAIGGKSYSATISANDGYELKSVTVTMGGSPVTVSGGNISIEEVTGDIVITAVAEEIVASYTNLADPASSDWWTDSRIGSDGTQRTDKPGYVVTNFIGPLSAGDVVRVDGMDFATNPGGSCAYKSDKSKHGSYGVAQLIHWVSNTSVMTNATINAEGAEFTSADSTIAYWRFCGKLTGTADDVIITINEPIE